MFYERAQLTHPLRSFEKILFLPLEKKIISSRHRIAFLWEWSFPPCYYPAILVLLLSLT